MGAGGRRRAPPSRRALLEAALSVLADVERELSRLRSELDMRTSVMTHVAWAPPEWQDAARETLAGLAERHPSRTLLLFPQAGGDALEADVSLQCFQLPELEHTVCTEVIELRLGGERARAPASLVLPLVLPDLPVFLRWRGQPSFGDATFEQLVEVVDRLVVDSDEWPDAPGCYGELERCFDRVAVSDIAWSRTLPWRRGLARRWPFEVATLRVVGPAPEAALLAGWLRSRLDRDLSLEHEPADALERVELDGEEVEVRREPLDASDLLSIQLDRFSRDPVYEAAVASAS